MKILYLVTFLAITISDLWAARFYLQYRKIYETWTKRHCNICLSDNVPRARSAHTPTVPKYG